MRGVSKKSFVKAIKSKVIIALLLACLALLMAWWVSKATFAEMLKTVDNITAPSERLRIVNVISRKIGTLDQLQKDQAFNSPERYRKGFKDSRQLREALDSLSFLYTGDSAQLARIKVIKRLLNERDKQFVAYLKVRARLVNSKPFSDQVKNINSIVSKNVDVPDSTVLATEEKISTTTIYPTEEKSRSFFGKIFGKRKTQDSKPIKIVNEEKVKRDTIALSAEDRMVKSLENSLSFIEAEQRRKSAVFLDKESELTLTNRTLIRKMFDVLREVEDEVVGQLELSGGRARLAISTGINVIGLILIVFVVLTGVLLYLILTDITRSGRYRVELEKAKDEAEYHGRAKQRFLANMSHEIRTPLQSIIGYSDLIKQGAVPEKRYVDAIYHSSEHLLQIVNEVLDYNRIISGRFTFSDTSFDLVALMDEVISVMRPQAAQKSLSLVTHFEFKGLRFIQGDPFRLKQILYNLIGNAIKFTESGQISLSSSYKRRGEDLHFTFAVQDTGMGISQLESERIFNEFEQGGFGDGQRSNSSGAGLGLTIIKSLIEQQGGRIYVKSKLNEGSVFTFYLVFRDAKGLETVDAGNNADVLMFGKTWVVDDDRMILDLFRLIFERNQVDHHIFHSPAELLDAPWDETVRFILMDIRMPDIDGISLCRILRERLEHEVKILAITAQVLPDERELLLSNGFDGIIMKPFREADILSAISLESIPVAPSQELWRVSGDLAPLRAMTYGDEEQLKKVLFRFHKDCEDDSLKIREALKVYNADRVSLIVHRVAGRLAQIGFKELATEFRICELDLRAQADLTAGMCGRVTELLGKLEVLRHSIS